MPKAAGRKPVSYTHLIMGVAAGESVKKVATVHCSGGGADKSKYEYIGIHDCLAAARLPGGGPLACKFGCLGMGSCESECPFDAIHVKDGVAVVDDEKCVACGKCVDICPRHIIDLEPYKTKKHVSIPCSSKDLSLIHICVHVADEQIGPLAGQHGVDSLGHLGVVGRCV